MQSTKHSSDSTTHNTPVAPLTHWYHDHSASLGQFKVDVFQEGTQLSPTNVPPLHTNQHQIGALHKHSVSSHRSTGTYWRLFSPLPPTLPKYYNLVYNPTANLTLATKPCARQCLMRAFTTVLPKHPFHKL